MARYNFLGRAVDTYGNSKPGSSIEIYLTGTSTPAIIYTARSGGVGISTTPQVTTDAYGRFNFYVDDSDYPLATDQNFDVIAAGLKYPDLEIMRGVKKHHDLQELLDDDHPQYSALSQNEIVIGKWLFSHPVSGQTPEKDNHLTRKDYVDSIYTSVSAASREQDARIRSDFETLHVDQAEPTGFVTRTGSSISFSDATSALSLAGNYEYYIKGEKYSGTSTVSGSIDGTIGNHFFYLDSNGVVNVTKVFDVALLLKNNAYIAAVYWAGGKHIYLGDERHGITWDWNIHSYHHILEGTKFESGLGLSNIQADGNGSENAHAQLGVGQGKIWDEDLDHTTTEVPCASFIPVFYRIDPTGTWQYDIPSGVKATFPVKSFDDFDGSDVRLAYNKYTGGYGWSQGEVPNLDYVLTHLFATNDTNRGIIAIQGQNSYATLPAAREGANTEMLGLSTGALPMQEVLPIATVIYQTRTSYLNLINARIVKTDEGDDYIDFRQFKGTSTGGISIADHGNLAGLGGDDHLQYAMLNGLRDFTGTVGGVVAVADTDFTQKLYVDAVSAASVEQDKRERAATNVQILSVSASSRAQDRRERQTTNVQIISVSAASDEADNRLQNYVDDRINTNQNKIYEGDSGVVVNDDGTGSITISADGSTVATFKNNDTEINAVTTIGSSWASGLTGQLQINAISGNPFVFAKDTNVLWYVDTNGQHYLDVNNFGTIYGENADYGIGYHSSSDTLQIFNGSTVGTNTRMVVDSAGRIGIGTITPNSLLHVSVSADGGVNIQTFNSTIGKYTGNLFKVSANTFNTYYKAGILFERTSGTNAIGRLHLAVNNTENDSNVDLSDAKLTILPDGKVGIGYNNPGYQLEVRSTSNGFRSVAGGVQFRLTENVGYKNVDFSVTADGDLEIDTAGSLKMMITSGGRIGINTNAPEKLLTLDQYDDNDGIKIYGYDDRATSWGTMSIGAGGQLIIDSSSGFYLSQNGTPAMTISSNYMRIADDVKFHFGANDDPGSPYNSPYWHVYNSSNTRYEFWGNNIDGAETDGIIYQIEDDTNKISLGSGTAVNEFSIDGTLAGNSDDAVPTEKAVKTYADSVSAASKEQDKRERRATNVQIFSVSAASVEQDKRDRRWATDMFSDMTDRVDVNQNKIYEGNSGVVVNDTGTGSVTISADGSTVATFTNGDVVISGGIKLKDIRTWDVGISFENTRGYAGKIVPSNHTDHRILFKDYDDNTIFFIGTNNNKFTFNSNIEMGTNWFSYDGNQSDGLSFDSNNDIGIMNSKVGIGDVTPRGKLDVLGETWLANTNSETNFITDVNIGNLNTADIQNMKIQTIGNASWNHIQFHATRYQALFHFTRNSALGYVPIMRLYSTSSLSRFELYPYSAIMNVDSTYSGNSSYVKFSDAESGYIMPSGSFGIGTRTPDSLVNIEGKTVGDGGSFDGSNSILHLKQNTVWSGDQPWTLFVEGYSYLNRFRINGSDGQRSLYKTTSGEIGFSTYSANPSPDSDKITFSTYTVGGNTRRLSILGGGNVGIGEDAPLSILHVSKASATYWNPVTHKWGATTEPPQALTITNATNSGYDPILAFRQTTSTGVQKNSGAIGMLGASSWTEGSSASQISNMYFALKDTTGALIERMRIRYDGKVSIGSGAETQSSSILAVYKSDGVAGDMLHLRDTSDATDLIVRYNDLDYEFRSESGGAGNLFLTFENSTGKVSLSTGTGINEFSIDGTMAGNSDDAVPTEKAVKTYSDNISAASVEQDKRLQSNVDSLTLEDVRSVDETVTGEIKFNSKFEIVYNATDNSLDFNYIG